MPGPDPAAGPAALAADGLACVRAGRPVFEAVAFTLGAGDLLAVQGPNGSGKSSLLRLLAGLLRPAAGAVSWAGRDIARDGAAHRARVHHLGAENALVPALSVIENLAFVRGVLAGRGALKGALDVVDLEPLATTPVRLLSTGQRRRAALARLLAAPRPLWLLDEPEAGLDRAARARLVELIGWQRTAGGIVVVATHDAGLVTPTHLLDLAA